MNETEMKSYKIELECWTGAKTITYVIARDSKSAMKIATTRVNKKSPNNWKIININEENKPDNFQDTWNK